MQRKESREMAKGDYKGTIFADVWTYRAWRAMFVP